MSKKIRLFLAFSIAYISISVIYHLSYFITPSKIEEIRVLEFRYVDDKILIKFNINGAQGGNNLKVYSNLYRVSSLCIKEINFILLNKKNDLIKKPIKKDFLGRYHFFVDRSPIFVVPLLIFTSILVMLIYLIKTKLIAINISIILLNFLFNMSIYAAYWSFYHPEQMKLRQNKITQLENKITNVESKYLFGAVKLINLENINKILILCDPLSNTDSFCIAKGALLMYKNDSLNTFFLLQSAQFIFISLAYINATIGVIGFFLLRKYNDRIEGLFKVI